MTEPKCDARQSGHTIEVRFVAKWGTEASLICHHDPADPKRPCWPHDEEGVPYPQERGEAVGCVYLDWFDNEGLEALGGETKLVRFDLDDAEWDGDGFTFVLGGLL